MKPITLFAALCVFAGVLALSPAANADQWTHQTRVTFSQPVEIPTMVLPPGTYVFKLLDSQVDRNIVQIFNEDQNRLYATILAVNDYRLKPKGNTVIMFEEREAGAPQAIRAWFYPGENYGAEFVYPQPRAAALAQVTHLPVPSMPATEKPPEAAELRQAPVTNQQPSGELTTPEPAPAPPQPAAVAPQEQAAAMPPRRLPRTASDFPLIGLMGLLSLALAGTLRFIRRGTVR